MTPPPHQSGPKFQKLKYWGLSAAYLLDMEQSGAWKKEHSSFSSYVDHLAAQENKPATSLWRWFSAGKVYRELKQKFDPCDSFLMPLNDPRINASPEALELVQKISRVAPASLVEEIQLRAMEGKISRRKLNELWQTYRPVLGGKTARGRGGHITKYDLANEVDARELAEANALLPIVRQGIEWLNHHLKTPYIYRVIPVASNRKLRKYYPAAPDVVVLVCEHKDDVLQIHAIESGLSAERSGFLHNFSAQKACVDFAWFLSSTELLGELQEWTPDEMGILEVHGGSLRIVRWAQRLETGTQGREALLRELLKEALKG